jgi:PAP2 superfamily
MSKCVSTVCLVLSLLVSAPHSALADPVTTWNANAGAAAIAACISPVELANPLHESRLYAITHVAIHDALNAIDRRFRPYAFHARAYPWASPEAAVASAAGVTLITLIGQLPVPDVCRLSGRASVETAYARALASIPDGPGKAQGIAIGVAAAATILALRVNDGSDTALLVDDYPQGTRPGEYRFTPGNGFVFAPGWGSVTPFVLRDGSQFRPRPPYRVASKKYAADLEEIKLLGGDNVITPSSRTPAETEIGLFWIESSPLQWNRIARTVTASRGLDAWENARLFGLLNMALADGYIGSWDAKYHYYFWRPVTAIREADADGNPETSGDPTWTPLQPTYAQPDYPSAHAVQGGAAAEVLARVFGTDDITFEVCSLSLPAGSTCADASPVLHSFSSFSDAANENGLSRILIGIHFRHGVEQGIRQGRQIADRAVTRFLRPVY